MTQYARPDKDFSDDGNWTGETGMSGEVFYTQINEASADDDDYIEGEDSSCGGVVVEVGLRNSEEGGVDVGDPSSSSDHKVYYRATDNDGSGSSLLVRLKQGSTVIASQTTTLTASFDTYYFTLSPSEANNIGDYNDLRLEFTFTDEECMGINGQISQAYFQCPDEAAAAAATSEAFLLFVD